MSEAKTRPGSKRSRSRPQNKVIFSTKTLRPAKWGGRNFLYCLCRQLNAVSTQTHQDASVAFTQIAQRGGSVRFDPPLCDARLWVQRFMTWNHRFIMAGTCFVPVSPNQRAVYWMMANAHWWVCTEMMEIWALNYMKASFFVLKRVHVLVTVCSFIRFFIMACFRFCKFILMVYLQQ